MDSSVSVKDEVWFLRVCHHISNAVLLLNDVSGKKTIRPTFKGKEFQEEVSKIPKERASQLHRRGSLKLRTNLYLWKINARARILGWEPQWKVDWKYTMKYRVKLIIHIERGNCLLKHVINHLMPNDHLSGRTAPLTYRCCIFYLFKRHTYWIF